MKNAIQAQTALLYVEKRSPHRRNETLTKRVIKVHREKLALFIRKSVYPDIFKREKFESCNKFSSRKKLKIKESFIFTLGKQVSVYCYYILYSQTVFLFFIRELHNYLQR